MISAIRIENFEALKGNTDKICYYEQGDVWYFFHPLTGLGNLARHDVVEHEDGTITVSPSILISTMNKGKEVSIHGFLEKGQWRDC